ncbi:hypothetical protein BVX97_01775, partial [bacterium E08(2017)]
IEIHFPKNHDPSGKVPGIIMFHGGAWRRGNRKDFRHLCSYFASRGLVAATAHYPFTTKEKMDKTVCVTGGKSAIRWFKQNAGELGVDPNRIIVGGSSAGGHIALASTLCPGLDDPADPKDIDLSVAAYVLFNPALHGKDKKQGVGISNNLGKELPPMLAMYGSEDSWKNRDWTKVYQSLKSKGKKDVDYLLAPGGPHTVFKNDPWRTLAIIEADKFLVKHGFLKGEPTMKAPAGDQKLIPFDDFKEEDVKKEDAE